MHKSMETATPSSTKDTPKSRNPKSGTPKKKSSQSGQKWFKGTPKSRSSKKLLKSPPVEKTPTKPPTPAGYVEFELDGAFERFSIYEAILCGNSGDFQDDIYPRLNLFGTPDADSSLAEAVGSSQKNKSHKKDSEVAKKGKTPQSNRNKIKSVDTDTKKKSSVCKLPEASYETVKNYTAVQAPPLPVGYIRYMEVPQEELADEVEYDLDGEDNAWLQLVNLKRKQQSLPAVDFSDMELLMDRLEKESYFQMQSNGIDQGALIDDDAVCCICMDGECQNSNAILFCDMCNLAVHQECYGVPYIPEGQWLCRRCLQSPSRAVDCALCPNKGGAFKQTDDGRWAHVVCAIWIPEVCFANTVFLEPVDSIGNIPPARWRLVCFICKQKGIGACIQCHKSNCYVAFHVTCAQQAGLCMKMDTVRDSSTVQVKKTAYCDNHAPPESDFAKEGEDGAPSPRQKMRQARKLLAEKRSAIPVLSIPTIPSDRVAEISQLVSFSRKNQFIKRLMAYWKLKRQSRNGVPLLRRLQASSTVPHPSKRDGSGHSETKTEESQVYYRYWLRLRQDLERARLLCELVRKREKVKKELIHLKCREVDIRLRPFCIFLLNVLDEISTKDAQGIFAEPVDTMEVPDYLDIVDKPMDLSTIREKINSFEYNNLDEFEADFQLMIDNCLNYNAKDTVFYRSAIRLQEVGGIIIRHARRSIEAIGFDSTTGLHLPERNHTPKVLTDEEIIAKVENCLSDTKRFDLPFDDHLTLLHEVLDETLNLNHPVTRKKKYMKMKHEIIRVRRLRHSKLNKLNSSSPLKQKYKYKQKTLNSVDEKDLSTVSKRGRKSLRGTEQKMSGLAKDTSEKTTGRRSLRPVQHQRDSSDSSSSNPPSPPVLRNSTISLSRTLEDKHVPPAKRLKRSVEKEQEERRRGKTRASVHSLEHKAESCQVIENSVDSTKPKERLNSVLKAAVSTGKSSPKTNASPGRTRKEFYSSPKPNSTVQTTNNSSPVCKKKILQVTPTKTPTKVCTRRSPSTEDKFLAKESLTASPTRRNSSRTKKLSNSAITINNNVIRNSIIPWNDTIVKDKNCASSERSESGSDVLPWSPKITSNVNSKNKGNYGSLSGMNSTPKRNTKNSSMQVALNNNEISAGQQTERLLASQTGNNVVTKPESFMVYRSSTRDTDLNSDDDDEDVDEDDDGNVNSDSGGSSDNDDESMDGVQDDGDSDCSERSLEDGNSENSVKKSKQESGASDNEASDIEESRSQGVSQELRRTRYETSLHVPRNRKADRIGNALNTQENVPDGHNCAEKLNNFDDEDLPVCIDAKLKPLDLVWAKCKDGSWYPALIINPETPAGFTQNDISIPQPPDDVLSKRPRNSHETFFLVLCFDTKRTWEWIPRNHLEPLGLDPKTDKFHLINRRSDKRAQGALRKAYEKALLHRNRVNGADRAPSLPS